MERPKLPFLLYIIGIILIISIFFIKNIYVGISFILLGFFLIMLSWFIPIFHKPKIPIKSISIEDFIEEIKTLLNLNENEIDNLKSPISQFCSIRNIGDLSNKVGLDQKLLKEYFKVIEQDFSFKNNLGKKSFEIILGRKYDVGLVGSIFLDLKKSIENSETENELRKKISTIIEIYSERYSLSNFIECQSNTLDDILKILVDIQNPFEFVISIIKNRVGVPHYESNIFAFYMTLYMLIQEIIKPKINDDLAKNIVSENLNILINESKLRDNVLKNIENIAQLYTQNEIKKDETKKLIMNHLEIYLKTLNITRKHRLNNNH